MKQSIALCHAVVRTEFPDIFVEWRFNIWIIKLLILAQYNFIAFFSSRDISQMMNSCIYSCATENYTCTHKSYLIVQSES